MQVLNKLKLIAAVAGTVALTSGTALAVLSKPVGKARFLMAKYVGLAGALALLTFVIMLAVLVASMLKDIKGTIYCFFP